MRTRFIGDVHGHYREYLDIVGDCDESIQVGDMGFDYVPISHLSKKHRFIRGNHDNYDVEVPQILKSGPHTILNREAFAVSGGFSIDCLLRVAQYAHHGTKTWWYEEEHPAVELEELHYQYGKTKPSLVISHDAPIIFKNDLTNPDIMLRFGWKANHNCRTQKYLQKMYETHEPQLWICGHFHKDVVRKIGATTFICLSELSYIDVDENLTVYWPNSRVLTTGP